MSQALGLGRPQFVNPFGPARTAATETDESGPDLDPDAGGDAGAVEDPSPTRPRRSIGSRRERGSDQRGRAEHFQRQLQGSLGEPPATQPDLPPIQGQVRPDQLGPVPTTGRPVTGGGEGGKGQGGKGQGQTGGGWGGVFDEGGRAYAQAALRETKPPSVQHPYMKHKTEIREDLDRLGLLGPGTGRVHIDDVSPDHGFAVTRAAVGPTSLAQGAETSLNTSGVPADFRNARRTDEQRARTDTVGERRAQAQAGELTSDAHVALIGDEIEGLLLDRGDSVAYARSQLPEDDRDTFMNMSWGVTPERLLGRSTGQMIMAPEGSAAYEEVTELLGHPPTIKPREGGGFELDKEEFKTVRAHLLGQLDPMLTGEAHTERVAAGKTALEAELTAGREDGLLVFMAAGNHHAAATRHGRPDLAVDAADGAEGLIMVGSTDLNGPGTDDDAVADFSNGGNITVSAAGVEIPVGGPARMGTPMGLPMGGDGGGGLGGLGFGAPGPVDPTDTEGTSISSPIVLEAGYLADAVNPDLGVDDIAKLLTDPRAVHDIEGTTRDGAGQIDHFAVALLAKNPNLSRAQIDGARVTMRGNPSDAEVSALKAQLGIE